MPGHAAPAKPPSPQRPSWEQVDAQESLVTSEDVLYGVASVLEHFIARSEQQGKPMPTAFDGQLGAPGASVYAFLEHIMNSGLCSKECFIMALVYGERILQKHRDFTISRNNVQRFVLISVLVGSKILDDFYCRNMYYAMAGGLEKAELNALELKLCDLLNFDLNVQPEEFGMYRDSLIRRADANAVQAQAQADVQAAAAAVAAAATADAERAAVSAAVAQQFAMPPANVGAAQIDQFMAAPAWTAEVLPAPAVPMASAIPQAAAPAPSWRDAVMQQAPLVPQPLKQVQHHQQPQTAAYQHPAFACGYADPLGAARAWFGSGQGYAPNGAVRTLPPHAAPMVAPMIPHNVEHHVSSANMWAQQLHV